MDLKAKRSTLTEQVAELLQRYIEEHDLEPGDELPSEQHLAETFGVSRTIVREGLSAAAAVGLIRAEPGRRPQVADLSGQVLNHFFANAVRLDTQAVMDILGVREALETYASRLAARDPDPDELARAGVELQAMEDALGRGDAGAFVDADVAFHRVLIEMSGNPLLVHLTDALREATRQTISSGLRARRSRAALVHVQEVHNDIYAALEARDPNAAAEAMHDHFRAALAALAAGRESDAEVRP